METCVLPAKAGTQESVGRWPEYDRPGPRVEPGVTVSPDHGHRSRRAGGLSGGDAQGGGRREAYCFSSTMYILVVLTAPVSSSVSVSITSTTTTSPVRQKAMGSFGPSPPPDVIVRLLPSTA